jgi:hypothetical protein
VPEILMRGQQRKEGTNRLVIESDCYLVILQNTYESRTSKHWVFNARLVFEESDPRSLSTIAVAKLLKKSRGPLEARQPRQKRLDDPQSNGPR